MQYCKANGTIYYLLFLLQEQGICCYFSEAYGDGGQSHERAVLHVWVGGGHEILAQHANQPLDLRRVISVPKVLHHSENRNSNYITHIYELHAPLHLNT